jgi:hypothetical protein
MRCAALLLLATTSVFSQLPVCNPSPGECLQGYLSVTRQQGAITIVSPPYLWVQAHDLNNNSATYSVRFCIDAAYPWWCPAGTPNSVTIAANTNGIGGSAANGYWAIPASVGSISLKDGARHYVAPWAISRNGDTQANDLLLDFARMGGPFPIQWDPVNSNLMPDFSGVSRSVTPITPQRSQLFINSNDPCSIGSAGPNSSCGGSTAGNILCTVNGTPVYDNGFAGAFLTAYPALSCSNAIIVSLPVQDAITFAQWKSVMGPAIAGEPMTMAAQLFTWVQPNIVVGNGAAAQLTSCNGQGGTNACYAFAGLGAMWPATNGIEPIRIPGTSACIQKPVGQCLGEGIPNPSFNNPVRTPASLGFRYTIMASATACSQPWNGLNGCDPSHVAAAGFTANVPAMRAIIANTQTTPTDPSGLNVQIPWTSDTTRGAAMSSEYSPWLTGNSISPNIDFSLLGSRSSMVSINPVPSPGFQSNVLTYPVGSNQYHFASLSMVPGGGLGYAVTSYGAQFASAGNDQAWIGAWMLSPANGGPTGNPAVAAGGEAVEPGEIITRHMFYPELFAFYYSRGYTICEAFWLSQKEPFGTALWGNPFARIFSIPAAPTGGFPQRRQPGPEETMPSPKGDRAREN